MSVALLPSPARAVWHLGPVPVRAYAICIILGVLVALRVASRRYAKIGGGDGIMLAVATFALPAGLIGARAYSVLFDSQPFIGHHWTSLLRIWDGKIGFPGALAAGALGAWIGCRRAGVAFGPVAGAAAPGIAFGQAIGRWGNWFGQALYGRPSTLPWAVTIAPEHRVRGYENFATFQPAFLYESGWDVAVGLLVIYAARRFLLTGDRTFALYAGSYAIGGCWVQAQRIDPSQHVLGLRAGQLVLAAMFAAAVGYLYLTRHEHGPDDLSRSRPPARPGGQVPAQRPGGRTVAADAAARSGSPDAEGAMAADAGREPHASG